VVTHAHSVTKVLFVAVYCSVLQYIAMYTRRFGLYIFEYNGIHFLACGDAYTLSRKSLLCSHIRLIYCSVLQLLQYVAVYARRFELWHM